MCKNNIAWSVEVNLLPGVEVHARELGVVGFCDVDVETLTLVDVDGAIGRHVDYHLLRNLPRRLVQLLQSIRDDVNVLKIEQTTMT